MYLPHTLEKMMNKPLYLLVLSVLFVLSLASCSQKAATTETLLAAGRQPQIAVDPEGVTRVVYGLEDKIYCATSTDQGSSFSEPVLVGQLPGLYLGMSMGPQIASSANYSVVTAIDKQGNIHSYRLHHNSGKWQKATGVNDVPGSVPEGLMSLTAGESDTFYAVWLDVRGNKQNKIAFATTTDAASEWMPNKLVYESPDSTVCECCKPSIAVKGQQVVLMFRNWLAGSRDFYVTQSTDGGKVFSQPQKLGEGTWKLEGCPMDGGGLLLGEQNAIHTVWQREGNIFYAQPGSNEVQIGEGRNVRISGSINPVISWQDNQDLKVQFLHTKKQAMVGKGSYMETAEMPDKKTLCVWEKDKRIYFKSI